MRFPYRTIAMYPLSPHVFFALLTRNAMKLIGSIYTKTHVLHRRRVCHSFRPRLFLPSPFLSFFSTMHARWLVICCCVAWMCAARSLACDGASMMHTSVPNGTHTVYTFHTGMSDGRVAGTHTRLSFDLCVLTETGKLRTQGDDRVLSTTTDVAIHFTVSNPTGDVKTLSHHQPGGRSFCTSFFHPRLSYDTYTARIESPQPLTYTLTNVHMEVAPSVIPIETIQAWIFWSVAFVVVMFICFPRSPHMRR
jgi:hypothetical protein